MLGRRVAERLESEPPESPVAPELVAVAREADLFVLEAKGFRLAVVAVTDHPQEYAAGRDRPGIAFADLGRGGLPRSLPQAIGGVDADAVLVTPHWGPNMAAEPVHHVRGAASALL